MFDPSQTPLVAETLLKKRRSLEELAQVREDTIKKQVKRRRVVRGENIKIRRPEEFMTKKLVQIKSSKKIMRKKRESVRSRIRKPKKETVGFAVRVITGSNISKRVKAELENLGLNNKYDGIFVKLDGKNMSKN
jgi:hypothetical protein